MQKQISYGKDYCKKPNEKNTNQRCGKELVAFQKHLGVLRTLRAVEPASMGGTNPCCSIIKFYQL